MSTNTTSSGRPAVGARSLGGSGGLFRFISTYGLVLLLVGLFVLFSILLPNSFPTVFNVRATLSDKAIVGLLALAEMCPVAANQFDLSIGYGIGLYQILAIGFIVDQGLPWPLAAILTIGVGTLVGLINGLLVTRVGIDSFIATLGAGTVLYGIAYFYAPVEIVGNLPTGFTDLTGNPGGIPLPAVFLVLVAIVLWIMFERLPIGRYMYMLGANARAAELTGISANRYVTLAFALSGCITGIAGVLLASKLTVASTSVGPSMLLPAFTGVFLGMTAIRPGRVNVIGTLVAVFLLAVAVDGLEQMGAQFWVEPVFDGVMLIGSVSLAAVAARRRTRIRAAAEAGL